jgi:hypothetical protein
MVGLFVSCRFLFCKQSLNSLFMKTYLFVTTILLAVFSIKAQTAQLSTAANITQFDGSVTYSIGQIFIHPYSVDDTILSLGIQQVYFDQTLSKAKNISQPIISFSPNPIKDIVKVSFSQFDSGTFSYAVYTLQGALISNAPITSLDTHIDIKDIAAGSYVLHIKQNNTPINAFLIQKK